MSRVENSPKSAVAAPDPRDLSGITLPPPPRRESSTDSRQIPLALARILEPALGLAATASSAADLQTGARALTEHWQSHQANPLLDTFRGVLRHLGMHENTNLFAELSRRAQNMTGFGGQALNDGLRLQLQVLGHMWNQELKREQTVRDLRRSVLGQS